MEHSMPLRRNDTSLPSPLVASDAAGIARAVTALDTGELVAFPTETVYGLGCDPFDEDAVHRLLAIKQRPV